MNLYNQNNFIPILFPIWHKIIPQLFLTSELKRTLLGMVSILLVDPANQSSLIASNLKDILNQIFELAIKLFQKRVTSNTAKPQLSTEEYNQKLAYFLSNVI